MVLVAFAVGGFGAFLTVVGRAGGAFLGGGGAFFPGTGFLPLLAMVETVSKLDARFKGRSGIVEREGRVSGKVLETGGPGPIMIRPKGRIAHIGRR
jgi:hypothetical protein